MKLTNVLLALTLAAATLSAQASASAPVPDSIRKPSTVTAFRKLHACPATGKVQTTCPGYVVDHMLPLCAGGLDTVENMQWQTTADSYKKDVVERDICRRLTTCEHQKK